MENDKKNGFGGVALFSVQHLACCDILLILSGVSLAFLRPTWPVIGPVLAVLALVGFIWWLRHLPLQRRPAQSGGTP